VFVINTLAACPVCTGKDFNTFSTTCIDGKQQTITRQNRTCNPTGVHGLPVVGEKTVECSLLWQKQWPIWLKVIVISIPVILASGLVLLSVVVYCWMRNKTLEYKYMKLVESSGNRGRYGDELPAAETCALDEGEEDDEHFNVTHSRQQPKFFHKFNDHGQEDDETFENIRMSQKSLLT